MAATSSHFQLFPVPVPKIKTNAPLSDTVVNFSRKTDSAPAESAVGSSNAESVVVKITNNSEQQPEAYYIEEGLSRSHSPEMENETVPASPIDGHKPPSITIPPTAKLEKPPLPQRDQSASIDPSPTSPVVPIRSMFPTYNPSLRLSQQQYFPQRATDIQRENVSREDYIPSRSPSRLDEALGPRTAPASIVDFPVDIFAKREPTFSSIPELERLWAATNGGHDPETMVGDFDLRMSRYESQRALSSLKGSLTR
jgi:hypothetical protein